MMLNFEFENGEMMKVSEFITKMVPYVPGKPIEETKRQYGLTQVFKLASNENPLGPSPKALDAIKAALPKLNLYPDGSCFDLKLKVSEVYKFDPAWILFGNGSDELCDFLVQTYCEPGDKILTSHRAFDTYRLSAQAGRCETTLVPMTKDYRFDLQAMEKAWTPKHKLVFLTNPNNPTGTYNTKKEMDEFLKFFGGRDDVVIVIDEAYFEFVRATDYPNCLEYVKTYPNVTVMRTMSKIYGLAGLRLGILFARPEITGILNRVRKPFNINSLMQVGAIAALDDKEFVAKTQKLTWKGLDFFYDELKKLDLDFLPSQGNFVLFDSKSDAVVIYEKLLREGVILRPVKNYDLPTHLRMSVGLEHENKRAIECLKKLLSSQ